MQQDGRRASFIVTDEPPPDYGSRVVHPGAQHKRAEEDVQPPVHGGGSKKPKLLPAPSAAPRASKLLNVTARALTSGGCTRKRARGKVLTIH